jgi:nucleoside-diphosphate-sugar epimerase
VRAFVTGATGFVGGSLARRLRMRGDDVVALVRDPGGARALEELGCEVVAGDLSSVDMLRAAMEGCDAVFHVAAMYRIGVPVSERDRMYEANVQGTSNALGAARLAAVRRILYVSTNSVLGDTGGTIVDETHERRLGRSLSWYDQTKLLAHELVRDLIAEGAPIVVVQPGGVYGPGDHTLMGPMLERALRGKPILLALGSVGLNFVYVDDLAGGILLAHDCGQIGETYILGGEIATLRGAIDKAFEVGGHRPRVLSVPTFLLRLAVPLGLLIRLNIRELISASDGVTYWGRDDKARRELGYAPRDLEAGLRDMLGALRSGRLSQRD